MNHQRTVKQLAEKPQQQNPTRSFDAYIPHLKLLKRISELIWDKPDWYTAEIIGESKVMKGLWMFISYCEEYYEDCYLVKRCHLNLRLIIEVFQNIMNQYVKAKHKKSFHLQRLSMLPNEDIKFVESDTIVKTSSSFDQFYLPDLTHSENVDEAL